MEKLDEFGLIPGFDPVPWYPKHDSIYEDNTSMDEYANHLKTRLHDAHNELGMVLTELRSNRIMIDETTTSIHKIGEELDELNGFISTLNNNKDLIPVEDFNVYSVTQFTNNILSKAHLKRCVLQSTFDSKKELLSKSRKRKRILEVESDVAADKVRSLEKVVERVCEVSVY